MLLCLDFRGTASWLLYWRHSLQQSWQKLRNDYCCLDSHQGYKRWGDIFCHMEPSCTCLLQLCGRCDYAPATVTIYYGQWCKAVKCSRGRPLLLICCLSKITKICQTGLWALILLKTSVIQILWAGFLWLPVLSCSCPAGHVRTWGNCEVWPLFTPGSQPERTKSPLTANTPLVHDSLFPHCQIEIYFSSITPDSS